MGRDDGWRREIDHAKISAGRILHAARIYSSDVKRIVAVRDTGEEHRIQVTINAPNR